MPCKARKGFHQQMEKVVIPYCVNDNDGIVDGDGMLLGAATPQLGGLIHPDMLGT